MILASHVIFINLDQTTRRLCSMLCVDSVGRRPSLGKLSVVISGSVGIQYMDLLNCDHYAVFIVPDNLSPNICEEFSCLFGRESVRTGIMELMVVNFAGECRLVHADREMAILLW